MLSELASAGLALSLGGYVYAANWPTSQIFGPTLVAGRYSREIALTYDDGPNDPYTLRLLEILAGHDIRATFFLIGRFVRQRPQIARALRAAGHVVGNHTMTHPLLLRQTPAQVHEQLAACNAAIEDATGETVRFFRPPHGARRPDILRTAREMGLTPVMWNVTGHDWTAPSPERIVRRVENSVRRNQRSGRASNVLLHDGGQARLGIDRSPTLAATGKLIEAWRESGHRLVTVEDWMESGPGIKGQGSIAGDAGSHPV